MATSQFIAYLDRRVELTGSYSAGTTTWTLPFVDATLNCIVPSFTAGAATDGVAVVPTTNTGTTVTKTGDYSGGVCTIGRTYPVQMRLSKPFVRDQQGQAILGPRFLVRGLTVFHRRAGPYSVRLDRPSPNADVSRSFTPSSGLIENNGIKVALLPGNPDREEWYIESTSATPMVITSLDWFGDFGEVCR